MKIARVLYKLGINLIEAGMPVTPKEDKEAMELILKVGLKIEYENRYGR